MYAIYGNIYHQYTPNVSIYTIHGSYGEWLSMEVPTMGRTAMDNPQSIKALSISIRPIFAGAFYGCKGAHWLTLQEKVIA